jgi:hypothetical protein
MLDKLFNFFVNVFLSSSLNFTEIQVQKQKHLFQDSLQFGIMFVLHVKNSNKHQIEVSEKQRLKEKQKGYELVFRPQKHDDRLGPALFCTR